MTLPLVDDPRDEPLAVIGAGIAGLITAYTLLQDGFSNVQVLTRDPRLGGTWAKERIYPNLGSNNVHGEYRVSPLEMAPPSIEDGRLSGSDIHAYLETFASKFLGGRIEYGTEVRSIRRPNSGRGWLVTIQHVNERRDLTREYTRIVLCTGGASTAQYPVNIAPEDAIRNGFKGMVIHSGEFGPKLDELLAAVPPATPNGVDSDAPAIIVVGGGKSGQDISAYLANEGRKVTVVCPNFDAFTAGQKPLPAFIRKSRFLSLLSPHIHLRTFLERLLHTTWIGKKIVDFMWHGITDSSFQAAGVPIDSPLRNTVSPYWHVRINDEGIPRANGFHALAVSGKINIISPSRVAAFGDDGDSVILDDGRRVAASVVVVAAGYRCSWSTTFDEDTLQELGLNPRPADPHAHHNWDYPTLKDAPPFHPEAKRWSSTMYRGLIPAKHINSRDFAVNGAVVSPNFGYTTEVASHWISSYFLGDVIRLPATSEAALAETERHAAWLRQRYPQIPTAVNGSHMSSLAFWSWPQHVDDLLEDMGLPVMRSGGNALTWPFKVIDLSEIQYLKEEREALRAKRRIMIDARDH
ncbi:FAD/NAD-P-binding domain-containing protein [Daedaleopsis nitida]|nr:FAD/NAD-P-binding domain-containing protein [Daedaleopsis nitida]